MPFLAIIPPINIVPETGQRKRMKKAEHVATPQNCTDGYHDITDDLHNIHLLVSV